MEAQAFLDEVKRLAEETSREEAEMDEYFAKMQRDWERSENPQVLYKKEFTDGEREAIIGSINSIRNYVIEIHKNVRVGMVCLCAIAAIMIGQEIISKL